MDCSFHTTTEIETSSAIAAKIMAKSADPDLLYSDLWHIRAMLDVAFEVLMEMEYGTGPNRNHDLDRVAAMVEISRGIAKRALDRPLAH